MKRLIRLLSCLLILSFVFIQVASAQLINYERRNQMLRGTVTKRSTSKPKPTPTKKEEIKKEEEAELPQWMKKIPIVKTKTERRYDVNRDKKLQTAEVKILLRDTIEKVEQRGAASIDSEILKEYDKNRDGVINRYELTDLRRDARS